MGEFFSWFRPGRHRRATSLGIVVGIVFAASLYGVPVSADGFRSSGRDVTGTRQGGALARAASTRLSVIGGRVRARELTVWRDAHGYLVAPRFTSVAVRPGSTEEAPELVPVFGGGGPPAHRTAASRALMADEQGPAAWALNAFACYERISDTWAWLDHCVRLFRLTGDGDAAHDYYGLQHIATAGSNAPWVLKSASISAQPMDGQSMNWVDWSPRGDRTGACQTYVVWVTAPLAGLTVSADRCETWDITKAQRGGDFRLDWYGCACTHERSLAFDISVSVAQGRAPYWYVPAEVHGFPF